MTAGHTTAHARISAGATGPASAFVIEQSFSSFRFSGAAARTYDGESRTDDNYAHTITLMWIAKARTKRIVGR
eukprot:5898333-Pleurochrysis_carterae.AAC.1